MPATGGIYSKMTKTNTSGSVSVTPFYTSSEVRTRPPRFPKPKGMSDPAGFGYGMCQRVRYLERGLVVPEEKYKIAIGFTCLLKFQ